MTHRPDARPDFPHWLTAYFCIAMTAAFFVGALIGQDSARHTALPPQGRWSPCFATAEAGTIPAWLRKMDAQAQADGHTLAPLAHTAIVPTGHQAGAWIPPGCVAVEDAYGRVVFWKDARASTPRFIPYAKDAL